MGHSQAQKAQSRERILQEASIQVRSGGLESLSVAKLMRSVGLTHGGFYGHFASRSELLACALDPALADGAAASRADEPAERPMHFEAFLRGYLSRSHRDARHDGCAIAALASDVARADEDAPALREAMTARLEAFIARVAGAVDARRNDDEAMFAVSAMVGGLLLSRVMADPRRSDALLRAVKTGLTEGLTKA